MKKILFLFTVIAIFTACNQSAPTISPDKESILRTGKWKLVSGTVTLKNPSGIDTTLNYMPFVPVCHLDDYIKFDSGGNASVFPGATKCESSDADSVNFNWRLLNNDNNMDILNVFNFFYLVYDSIVTPYYFDTISQSPILVLDTLSNNPVVVLDTIWRVKFDSAAIIGPLYYQGVNIYSADISNFSKSGFTLSFKWYTQYPDTTKWHEGGPPAYQPPIMRTDTLKYVLNYANF